MTANATILVEELTDVLTVPTWVVRVDRGTGQTYVHRQVGGTVGDRSQLVVGDQSQDVERVEVELGVRHEGVVQVLGGLSEGDRVIWIQESPAFFGPQ